MHATDPIATPFIRLAPIETTREILRDHLANTDAHTVRARGAGEGTLKVEKGQMGEGAKESRGEKEKEGENFASSSKMLLAKLRGEEEVSHLPPFHLFPMGTCSPEGLHSSG